MKITDEIKRFASDEDGSVLSVSSNMEGIHEHPSLYMVVEDPPREHDLVWVSNNPDEIIQIIEHMAKMGGLEVSVKKLWGPVYQPGDRVRSLAEGEAGLIGTVLSDTESSVGWYVRVLLDGSAMEGLYTYDELEPVTKSS